MPYRRLNDQEQTYICQIIHSLLPVARDATHPMREIARWFITQGMWRWTADGVDLQTGVATVEAIKYSVVHYPATATAQAVAQAGSGGLRHEHAVPIGVLACRIIEQNPDIQGIQTLLRNFCKVAIVTKEEDKLLKPRSAMPDGWNWGDGNPYQRYEDAHLNLQMPPNNVP
jgi:hypothetical protein